MKRVWILDTSEESATPLVRSLPSLMYETSVWTEPTSFLSALDDGLPDLVVIEHGIGEWRRSTSCGTSRAVSGAFR